MKKKGVSDNKAGVLVGMTVGLICMAVFMYGLSLDTVVVEDEYREMTWRRISLPFLGDADPGSGASGVLEVYVNATNLTVGSTEYNTNLTTGYETGTVNNSHIGSDVPYDTAFDVIVKVRWNKTHAYDTAWNLSLVRAYANSSDLGVTAIQMNETSIVEATDFVYVHYYLHDADGGVGTGFTIAEGVNVTSFSVNFESYYYA